jgi:O-6-methylguanine DNA methyltransferase
MEYADILTTPWGDVAVVSRGGTLSRLFLPGEDLTHQASLGENSEVGSVVEAIALYFEGQQVDFRVDFGSSPLNTLRDQVRGSFPASGFATCPVHADLGRFPSFSRSVLAAASAIPYGQTATYGLLSLLAFGNPRKARAIGQVMARNPIPLIIPCHRVLASNGPGGFSSPGGVKLKQRMLAMEAACAGR